MTKARGCNMAISNQRAGAVVIALVIIFLSFSSSAFAEKVTFVKEYTYQASELDSKHSCRTISLEMVKRLLLEEFGTYLISETEVKDFKLTKDQVTTYSAGIVSAEVIEEKWDGKTYWLKAKVSADPKEAAKSLKKIMDEPFKGKELEETRKKAEELTKEVERLNKELAKATNKQPSKKVQQEYKTAIQGLTANEWLNKGYEAAKANRWEEAKDDFTEAIKLKPDYAEAYIGRGAAYGKLDSYQQAIKDFTKAIELKQNDVLAYFGRGIAYGKLGNYQQAIKDYTKAIGLNPPSPTLKPSPMAPLTADAYCLRALAYVELGNEKQAIADIKIAARLGNKTAQDFLKEQGIKW
jgi:tetratricopeptide (TPR) repeat protein